MRERGWKKKKTSTAQGTIGTPSRDRFQKPLSITHSTFSFEKSNTPGEQAKTIFSSAGML